MRYAVVDEATRTVVNVIEAPVGWTVEPGLRLIPSSIASPDDHWEGRSRFTRPALLPTAPTLRERFEAASTVAEKLDVLALHLGLKE